MSHLPRSLVAYAPAEPRGRHNCHSAGLARDQQGGTPQYLNIYLEVYKLHRLPSSPPGEPAILEEVSTTIPGHSWDKEETPNAQRQPSHKDFHPSQMRRPC